MASTDARPFPLKNTAYRVTFPILDADGDLVAGAASLDSEVSQDGGTFADCTNEATEIATSSGVYYLDLTSTEMNADTVAIIVKTSTSGAKTTVIVLYPVEGGDIDVDVTYINGSAVSTSTAQLGVNVVQAAGTAWGSGAITSSAFASGAINAAAIAADAIGASELAADAVAEIADAVWDEARSGHTTAGTFGEGVVVSSIATAAITAAAIAADAIGASELATDAVTEIVAAVWAAASRTLTANTNLNDPSAATIADAVWDEARSGHTTAGTFGQGVASVASGGITAATFATDAITSTALASSAVTEIQSGLSTLTAGQVNAEVVDALATDTYAEPGSVPAATASLAAKVNWLFMLARNKRLTTASADKVRNDADSGDVATATLSDDGTTFTRGEYA